MRIAVASDDGITIAGHFGRCAAFEIFEANDHEAVKIESRANSLRNHHHGHRPHVPGQCAHQGHEEGQHSHEPFLIALHDCQAVICRGMGGGAVHDLTARGIKPVITSQNISAEEAVRLYMLGKLDELGGSQCCSH